MIMAKGGYMWDLAVDLEMRELKDRVKQLETYIKKKGLRVPRKRNIWKKLRGGYNTDSEE